MKFKSCTAALASMLLCFSSCSAKVPTDNPEPETPEPVAPEVIAPSVTSLSLPSYPKATVVIDDSLDRIDITLPYGSVLGKTVLNYTVSDTTAVCNPASGAQVDLSRRFNLNLSVPGGKARSYQVYSCIGKSSSVSFKWIQCQDYLVKGSRTGDEYVFNLPYGTDVTALKFNIPSDFPLSVTPDITAGVDLTAPLAITLTAEDGITTEKFTLRANVFPKDTGVRGVYVPSPSHTSSFISYKNVCESLDLLQELHFNMLFLGSWCTTKASWPSTTLLANSTYSTAAEGNMYAAYSGGSGDVVADIISEAHKRGIKVVMWFEYGFMHKWGSVDRSDPVLARHPSWMGVNASGEDCNYNGTDFYYNGYDPEVQQFMIDLICEAVERYPDLDGIQGDDRLPAMPRNSGYNEVTREAYKAAKGSYPPSDYQDADWVRWRLDNLNAFAVKLYDAVKAVRPGCMVCFAPNKYPWCEGALMQDWPAWVKAGIVDLMTVQCYVTAIYNDDVKSQFQYMEGQNIFNPAMILKNGDTVMSAQMISDQLQYNRLCGTNGESQFWFDGLKDSAARHMFELWYHD